ncbi:hypothetical protein SNOG_05985 [Parastagonospora nodorum SN15]|uniref:Spindle pole body component n=1 Tax=Phaeosphaeria nodorum (strain SN15 / ATCC MYA-4574 / FGSC 10173) TaxID=321614 RepID=Q0UQH9_PHANO|nr:hypothetical protein SNOG_05985 [Parastagonospora nodorum SN15]EAT87049.2 hypothetical protein SNOG_05985 [Parastagonospora nodorum SN15]
MMDGEAFVDDVFSSDQLWKQSTLFADSALHESALFAPLQLDSEFVAFASIKFDHPYAPKHELDRELRLPDLDTFEFGPLPELDNLDASSISLESPCIEPEEDIWQVALELGPANKDVLFHTWEGFQNSQHVERRTAYITESGPEVFDAALQADDTKLSAGRVLKGHVFLQSLWNLGLGRSSILFDFNTKLKSFEPTVPQGRTSGLSPVAAQSLVTRFIHTGNTFLYLRSFAAKTFASATSIPARVALATTVSSVLYTLEEQLGKYSSKIRSLIQLQHQFSKPREVLLHVARMVDATQHAKTNEQLASILHHRLLELEDGDTDIRQLSSRIMCEVAKPSLELLAEWIGTMKEQETIPVTSRDSFVTLEPNPLNEDQPEYVYRSEMMPRFILPEDGNMAFETGQSLRFLKTQHPGHPLVRLHDAEISPPKFQWAFGWQDIEAISNKAKQYEHRLRTSLLAYSSGSAVNNLPRQYHLIGDGVFSSLLATALFDPERESAERHKGQMRSALRGVLSESYYSSSLYQSLLKTGEVAQANTTISGRDNDELPGQLNFAIRNLTEAEQEKVMDPDALSALDFLRLQYVPPTPLNLIITTEALDKYDLVFKFLLRLLRMLFVISHLPHRFNDLESRQLKLEAHHFVTMFAGYVFQSGIAGHWQEFDSFVSTLETRINEEDAAGEYGTRVTEGIASLRDAHDKCLDTIMFSLFLRRRQRKILALVDEIFDHILLFAKMQQPGAKVDETVKEVYDKLRGKIRVFLSVCRSLTGKKGYGSGNGTAEENLMERLVLGMEMNAYFAGA